MRYAAKQYAEALRASVADVATYREVVAELTSVAGRLTADPTVREFFTNRATPVAQQEKALHDVFRDALSERTYAFLRALFTNRQARLLSEVIRCAEIRADGEDIIARIHIVSAVPLTATIRTRLEAAFASRMERRVIATYEEQSSVIGGVRVTINHATQWDASVAGRFSRLQERIRAATS